jgi:putative tryptophan/tyrosine transport system substrate-binding protein
MVARGQPSEQIQRIGVVMGLKENNPAGQALIAALLTELQKFGWMQGINITIDVRYATDDRDQIRALARELMGLKPDLMVAHTNLVTEILQSEVRTIPLVFIGVADPIGSGFVTNFSRPTGNLTGFTPMKLPWGANGWGHYWRLLPTSTTSASCYIPRRHPMSAC